MKQTKKITILHSNDLHGDFLAEQVDEKLVGGVSMLCLLYTSPSPRDS